MSAFVSVSVATIVGEVARPYFSDNQGILFAIVAVSALLSENIVAGIISSGSTLQEKITKSLEKSYSKLDKDGK